MRLTLYKLRRFFIVCEEDILYQGGNKQGDDDKAQIFFMSGDGL